ncbi:protein of unknown function (plasmid) [Shinella sp. WSC3-e]|nr:protein of unknown function [Shinella sp. WSC3-e]
MSFQHSRYCESLWTGSDSRHSLGRLHWTAAMTVGVLVSVPRRAIEYILIGGWAQLLGDKPKWRRHAKGPN